MDIRTTAKESLEKHLERCEQKTAERRETILRQLQTVKEMLLGKYPSIQRIVVIGSLAKPMFFSIHSDVDIVISGLKSECFFEAYLLIEEALGLEDIDLIREEEASELLMRKIEEGIVLYDSQK